MFEFLKLCCTVAPLFLVEIPLVQQNGAGKWHATPPLEHKPRCHASPSPTPPLPPPAIGQSLRIALLRSNRLQLLIRRAPAALLVAFAVGWRSVVTSSSCRRRSGWPGSAGYPPSGSPTGASCRDTHRRAKVRWVARNNELVSCSHTVFSSVSVESSFHLVFFFHHSRKIQGFLKNRQLFRGSDRVHLMCTNRDEKKKKRAVLSKESKTTNKSDWWQCVYF